MKRSYQVQKAHELLQKVNKRYVLSVLENVNISPQEKDIITKSEIEKMRLAEIMEIYNLSLDSIQRIKTNGMKKIAVYIEERLQN